MHFGKIDRCVLFGGSFLLPALCELLVQCHFDVIVFTSDRHLADQLGEQTLEEHLTAQRVQYFVSSDINREPRLDEHVTPSTLGLAIGAAWVFEPALVALFGGKFVDFMGVPLPRYRGGAHYSWQILAGERKAGCNLQVVLGGAATFHRGPVIKTSSYVLPSSARTPLDYFNLAVPHEVAFMGEFVKELQAGQTFPETRLDESEATYWPPLSTTHHGYIDWTWPAPDVDRFICAFDDPYAGASTFLEGKRVLLKGSSIAQTDQQFHPFQAGLIYRQDANGVVVAVRDGALAISKVLDQQGRPVNAVPIGARFVTPRSILDAALSVAAVYTANGLDCIQY